MSKAGEGMKPTDDREIVSPLPYQDPSDKQQLAALVHERFRNDRRYPYHAISQKLWRQGYKNVGWILEALQALKDARGVRDPWAYVMSPRTMGGALARDVEARAEEQKRSSPDMPMSSIADVMRQMAKGNGA